MENETLVCFFLLFQVKTCDLLYQKAKRQGDLEVISAEKGTINEQDLFFAFS